jgi:hypothetical protein
VLQEVEIISSFQVVSGWGVKGRYDEDTRCSLKFDLRLPEIPPSLSWRLHSAKCQF